MLPELRMKLENSASDSICIWEVWMYE